MQFQVQFQVQFTLVRRDITVFREGECLLQPCKSLQRFWINCNSLFAHNSFLFKFKNIKNVKNTVNIHFLSYFCSKLFYNIFSG